jgi:hypothetical protein
MRSRTLSDHWYTLRPHLTRFQAWLAAREWSRTVTLLLGLIAAVVIARMVIRKAATGKELADLISALASLAWPIAAVVIVHWFRPQIGALLVRMRKGKFLGTEFELDELQAKTEAAEARLAPITGSLSATENGSDRFEATGTAGRPSAEDDIEEVLRQAARSPKLGLMLLSTKIERAARELASITSLDVSRRPVPLSAMIRALAQAEQLSSEDAEALNLFNYVRNRIVHGHDADDHEIARAIDSGTRLLRILLRPRIRH